MKNVLALVIFSLIFSCCSNKKFTSSDMPDEKITFGSGGGFSGYYTEYVLLKNGQLFQKMKQGQELIELAPITKKDAKSLFERSDELKLATMDFKEPDNYTHYIEVTTTEHQNKIAWGKQEVPISSDIKEFFRQLKLLPHNNKKTN